MSDGVPHGSLLGARDPHALVAEVLIEEDAILDRVGELGAAITRDYAGRRPILVCVLKGAFVFLGDLARAIDLPLEIDFMAISSYGSGVQSSGVVRILKDLETPLVDRDVIVVEDIVDSGLTLSYLLRNLAARSPRTLEVCALLTKPERRETDVECRYVGFEIANRFVVGYGLDYDEGFRNTRMIGVIDESRL